MWPVGVARFFARFLLSFVGMTVIVNYAGGDLEMNESEQQFGIDMNACHLCNSCSREPPCVM